MDLSIRVIAFNTFCDLRRFASRHPHLSVVQVFKDRFAAPFRLIRQQQRGEIMKNSSHPVKLFRNISEIFSFDPASSNYLSRLLLVAGAGLEPATFGL